MGRVVLGIGVLVLCVFAGLGVYLLRGSGLYVGFGVQVGSGDWGEVEGVQG